MSEENLLIQKRIERPIPGKIQRNQIRHQIPIRRDGRPRPRRDRTRRLITQIMNIHDLTPERRTRALDIDQLAHILQLSDGLLRGRRLGRGQVGERLIDVSADFIGRGIVSDDGEEVEGVRFVSLADESEEVGEEITVVGEFIGGAFCGDATALVEGFVEDADSLEGLAVCAGRCAGALSC